MANYYELATSDKAATDTDAKPLIWSKAGGDTATVRASVNPWLTSLGSVSSPAVDLVRIATAALIADRRSPRPRSWSREIKLRVHAQEPSRWAEGIETVSTLLQFLSGDVWEIELVPDTAKPPKPTREQPEPTAADSVALFSGGLDSFCGALIAENAEGSQAYVSQRDNPTVAASQNRSEDWLRANARADFQTFAITLAQGQPSIEVSSRTRSLLFFALGIAAAEGKGAPLLTVPENGFTSLNPPLSPDRAGALSTRSTHPYSFALLTLLQQQLGLGTAVKNPYAWLTKGELTAEASKHHKTASSGFAVTLSCAKLDGRLYKGGNQNWNCGLCVACISRRAAIASAGISDETPYVATKVKKSELAKLTERRRVDIQAVKWALAAGVDEDALLAATEFPIDYDIDAALNLWERALKEIALVDLP